MELLHHPRTISTFLFEPEQSYDQKIAHKPDGFWVSVKGEDDWRWWCQENSFCVGSVQHSYAVQLTEPHNVLVLDSGPRLQAFTDEYITPWEWEKPLKEYSVLNRRRFWPIDWRRVEENYGGIIIAPYQWRYRMDLHWYYGWDCASGCIWDLSQVFSVDRLPSMELTSDNQ